MPGEILRTPFTRVFLIEDGAAPNNPPQYMGLSRAQGISWAQGSITPVRKPSASQYGQFQTVDTIRGAPDLPGISLENRLSASVISDILRIVRKGCALDLHIHAGSCQNPDDFDNGFEVGWIFEGAIPSNYGTTELGTIDADGDAVVTETIDVSAENMYQIKKIRPAELAASEVTDVISRVLICDSRTCGECGIASDGCQIMFALPRAHSGSPGLSGELLYSQNGGATWGTSVITTLSIAQNAGDMACVGTNLAVISTDSNSVHYVSIADLLSGSGAWNQVTSGFVGTKTPNRIYSVDRTHTWIVAQGGYIYFSDDITAGVTVQTDGSVTAQNLTGVHAFDENNIVAVGASNAVLVSSNGGVSWTLVVGPAAGVALNCVFMQSAVRWLVGTAGGELWYTLDSGGTWHRTTFSGSGAGNVRAIAFSTRNIGYMVHDTATTRGRLFRTYNGGNSWLLAPEERGITAPSVASLLSVAACRDDPNVVIVGGTQVNGTDGYVGKYA